MSQPDLGMGRPDQVMWKLAPLILIFGVITLASSCGGEGQEVRPAPSATTPATEGPISSPSAAATGKIASTSWRDGNFEVYVVNTDGSALTNLSNDPAEDDLAAWSPDGSRIAFSDQEGESYVMNADGSSQTRLTDNLAWDGNPAGSPGP